MLANLLFLRPLGEEILKYKWYCPIRKNTVQNLRFVRDNLGQNELHFFYFRPEMPLFGKCGPKNRNGQFKQKFGIETNSNLQKPVVVFALSILDRKYPF